MLRDTGYFKKKGSCIICEKNNGTVITKDGPVCRLCMPMELLPRADSIGKSNIEIYYKTHENWDVCPEQKNYYYSRESYGEERSAAITMNHNIVLVDELNRQISTADRIDIVVSFIKMSGLNLIIDKLRNFCVKGKLRVITTAYIGATEYEAINTLLSLNNTEIRMELDIHDSRLHAKSIIFYRNNGNDTAFIGSANISKSALTSGEEWVVKLLKKDVPGVFEDLKIGYETLWDSGRLRKITISDRAEVENALEKSGI